MNLRKIISAGLLAGLLAGCGDDFLDKAPLETINSANYFKTENDAIYAINGAYQPLQWPKLYNLRMWTTDIMAGNSIVGAGGGTDGIETQDMANFVVNSANEGVLDLWRGPAPGILRCNIILQQVPAMNISEPLKNRILGEARFLRGHYYFILVRFFGDVPLILEPQNPAGDLRPMRASVDRVYEQIIEDLEIARTLLPVRESYTASDIGRASKGAAAGMLAKVYLTLGNYQKTLELAEEVTSLGYSLNDDYAQNFDPLNPNSRESLFEVQYAGKTNFGFWSDENQASWLSTFTGPRNSDMVFGGWGWNQPTEEFVDSYEEGDLRKDATILYEGGPDFDGQAYQASYSFTGYNLRKFLVSKSVSAAYDDSPLNFPVLRYADVLLMKAEALNELDRVTEAEEPLNEVRQRAGLGKIHGLSKDAFREKVLHERRVELAFEGHRWFDLIRAKDKQSSLNFLHSIGKTNATLNHFLFPIPQKERDANPNLTQNPGY